MSDYADTSNRVNQSGKSGGDVHGVSMAASDAYAQAGGAFAAANYSGPAPVLHDGGAFSSASGMAGGDVTDNTSISTININS